MRISDFQYRERRRSFLLEARRQGQAWCVVAATHCLRLQPAPAYTAPLAQAHPRTPCDVDPEPRLPSRHANRLPIRIWRGAEIAEGWTPGSLYWLGTFQVSDGSGNCSTISPRRWREEALVQVRRLSQHGQLFDTGP
jgi:hypothetical protein